MKKRITALLLCLVMAFSLIPTTAWANPGEIRQVKMQILRVSDEYYLGYNYTSGESMMYDYTCQYTNCGSGSYNHSIKISDIKAAAQEMETSFGVKFAGWTKTASANPTIYSFNTSGTTATQTSYTIFLVVKEASTPKADITLTYDGNGNGSDVTNVPAQQKQSVKQGESATFTISSEIPVRSDFDFLGWADSATATAANYHGGDSLTTNTSKTIYAVWKTHEHSDRDGDGFCDTDRECMHPKDDNGYCTVEGCTHPDTCCPKPEEQPVKPDAPTDDKIRAIQEPVLVDCVTPNKDAHGALSRPFIRDTWARGNEVYERNGEYYFDVTITNPDPYVTEYNGGFINGVSLAGHTYTETGSRLTVTLKYNADAKTWQRSQQALVNCVCEEEPSVPDAPTDKEINAGKLVTVKCLNPTTGKDDCTDCKYGLVAGMVGDYELEKVDDYNYLAKIPVTAFVNAYCNRGNKIHHDLYSADTLTYVVEYNEEAGKWTSRPRAEGVDDVVYVTHAPTKWQEVGKIGGKIAATCTTGSHGPISYGLTTAFVYYNTDVESVVFDGNGTYTATIKTDKYVDAIAKACNDNYHKDDARAHKLTSDNATVQWKFQVAQNEGNYTWSAAPVTDKDGAITVSHELFVTFQPENGEAVFTQNVYGGEKAVKPTDPIRAGYTFLGWYLGETAYDFDTPVTEDITLTGKWEITPHNVYAYTRLMSAFFNLTPVEFGDSLTLNNATLARLGLGSYNENGFISIGSFVFRDMPLTDDLYMSFYEDPELDAAVAALKQEQNINRDLVNKIDWTVLYKTENEEDLAPGYPTDDMDSYQLSGNLNLSAVMFQAGGENVENMPAVNYSQDSFEVYDFYFAGNTFTMPADPTREGYTFLGWKAQTIPTGDLMLLADTNANEESKLYKAGEEYTIPAGDVVFVAQWQVNVYTVSFDSNGGSEVDDQTVEYGKTVTEPKKPTRPGYTFRGWFVDEKCTEKYDFSSEVTSDMTLYAKWKKKSNGSTTPTEDTTKTGGKKVESGKTFDAGIGLYVGLSILSATGGALVIGKKKEF